MGHTLRVKPDFTGTWRLNLERSRLEIPAPSSLTVRIEHREPSFALSARHVYGERSRDVHFELTTDGKEAVVKDAAGAESHRRMYWEGESLVLDVYWFEGETKATNVVKYTLSEDGHALTAVERAKATKYAYHNVWVLQK